MRRARPPARSLFTLPGGSGRLKQLARAIIREVAEETGLAIEPVAIAGHREGDRARSRRPRQRHFVILAFAARWRAGEQPSTPNSKSIAGSIRTR
ncbi:MAG: NUDIX domain-containing protein [Xanthobacteraceae bacterium]